MTSPRSLAGLIFAALTLSAMSCLAGEPGAGDVIGKTGLAGGFCSFPRYREADRPLVLELAKKPSFVVHAMSSDEKGLSGLRAVAEAEGLLGRSLYVEKGDALALPYADRLVDLLVVTDLADGDLTPEGLREWTRVLGPKRGAALVGRATDAGPGLSRSLAGWIQGLPLARTVSDASGTWAVLRTERPPGSEPWSHRLHGADNAQVSGDTTFRAPFLAQWWGMPRQEGFWGTTVVSCNGRMFSLRGSRNSRDRVSMTARSLNNGVLLWQKRLRQESEAKDVPHGGYIPGRSCAVATDDSLLLVFGGGVLRLKAETGEEAAVIPGPKEGGQVKWIGCCGNLLAILSGEPDVATPISYQTVSNTPTGRNLSVYDLDRKQELWRDTVAGDIDEKLIAARDGKLYALVQGVGLVSRDMKDGKPAWVNPDADLQAAFKTPELKVIRELLVSLPVMSVYEDVLMLRAKWVKDTYAVSRKDGALLWKKPTAPGSYRGLTACAVDGVWVGGQSPLDMRTGKAVKGPDFISSGCGPTMYVPGYLISCYGKVQDARTNALIRNEDLKSPCDVGTIVTEGTMVTMPSECGCLYEVKGYRALVSAGAIQPNTAADWKSRRVILDAKEPAALAVDGADWPTYRHDASRSAGSPAAVGKAADVLWHWKPLKAEPFATPYAFADGQYLKPDSIASAPVTAAGRVWFASADGMVRCLEAPSGRELWRFPTGGRVFAPPTLADGRALVGGGDGTVYCLDATTGACLWKFQAAPVARKLFWFGHLISTWPVVPGVAVQDGVAYTVAGYQRDNGIHAYALSLKTGDVLWEKHDAATGPGGLESLGNIAIGNGRMWVCGVPGGSFDLKTGDWKAVAGGQFGTEIAVMDTWVLRGGRRLSETQDTLNSPLGGAGFAMTRDGDKPQTRPLCEQGICLPAWDAGLAVTLPKGGVGSLLGTPGLPASSSSWTARNVMFPVSFALARDQVVVASSDRRTHRVGGYSRFDGSPIWTLDLPEQPAMNRMALDRDGRVVVGLCDGSLICIAGAGPFVDRTVATRDTVTFFFKRAEGGLSVRNSPDGAIQGLSMRDATGASRPAKARIEGTSLIVDIGGIAYPAGITYTGAGNLGARGGPASAFEWKTPSLQVQQCLGKRILLRADGPLDHAVWKNAESYSVSGAKVAAVECVPADRTVCLITDKTWAVGEKASIKYPADPAALPGVTSELAFTAVPGLPVDNELLGEFLIGEMRENIDPATIFGTDDLDRKSRPVAGGKWKHFQAESGMFDLTALIGGQNNILAHACTYLYSDENRKVQLWAGSDDGLQVTVNGKIVHTNPGMRGCAEDQDKVANVELVKGWNTVLLGISQGGGGWGFCLRVKDEKGAGPPRGLRYSTARPDD